MIRFALCLVCKHSEVKLTPDYKMCAFIAGDAFLICPLGWWLVFCLLSSPDTCQVFLLKSHDAFNQRLALAEMLNKALAASIRYPERSLDRCMSHHHRSPVMLNDQPKNFGMSVLAPQFPLYPVQWEGSWTSHEQYNMSSAYLTIIINVREEWFCPSLLVYPPALPCQGSRFSPHSLLWLLLKSICSDFSKRQPSEGSSGKAGKQDFPLSRGLQSCQVLHSQAPGGGPRAFYHCISVIAASSWSRKYGKPFTWWKVLARSHGCLVSCDFTVLSRRLAREKVDLARPVKVTVFLLFFSNLT